MQRCLRTRVSRRFSSSWHNSISWSFWDHRYQYGWALFDVRIGAGVPRGAVTCRSVRGDESRKGLVVYGSTDGSVSRMQAALRAASDRESGRTYAIDTSFHL